MCLPKHDVRAGNRHTPQCMCVCALFSMPACHSDLPITRSIKSLIPKIHASDSMTLEKKSLPRKKWLNLPFPVACSLSHTPVQCAIEHEHGNVFYLRTHTGDYQAFSTLEKLLLLHLYGLRKKYTATATQQNSTH